MTRSLISRRAALRAVSASLALANVPALLRAQPTPRRTFDPRPGTWRTFDVVTTVHLRDPEGAAKVWIPVPVVNTSWQRSLHTKWSGNAERIRLLSAGDDARCVLAEFAAATPAPTVQVTSRVRTMDRAVDWTQRTAHAPDAALLHKWTLPTSLAPIDGIVRKTAEQITAGTRTDLEKARRIYDWLIVNTYREPKVRGCGIGDIRTMLETGNLGGKCADLNGLFVGLCRAAGLPARDVYGVRLAPSEFGYRSLGSSSDRLEGAQHCRAEVYLREHAWVAMDPADVEKVMREETGEWIKDADDPLVAPVRKALFGGWAGNWMAYNMASDVTLPGSRWGSVGFFMYPQAESRDGRYDSLDAARFRYTITANEVTV